MADFVWYALPILGCFGLYLVWMFLETLIDDRPAPRNSIANIGLSTMVGRESAEIEIGVGVPLGQMSLALPAPTAASSHEPGGQFRTLLRDASYHAVGGRRIN